MVVVDRFTKTGVFIATTPNFIAKSAAEDFFEAIVITDRDPRLIKLF